MLKKTDFKPYKVGTVFNPLKIKKSRRKPVCREIKIRFPSRLNAMAIDPSKIAVNKNLIYTPGEIVFSVSIYKKVRVKIIKNKAGVIKISSNSKRKSLIRHAAILMKKVIGFKDGLDINVENEEELRHYGLGSSSGLIASVACAINEIYGNPIRDSDLVKYLAQNHGEEIENREDLINPVQCIGGAAAAGIFKGGLLILAGESCVVKTMEIPAQYKVIIGIPIDFQEQDSRVLLEREIKNFQKFIRTGKKFGLLIAYNVFHKVLPAIEKGNLKTIGDVIFDYRFNMDSIKNCSFIYPKLVKLAQKLSMLKKKKLVDILSLSSVGPAFFVITKKPYLCLSLFKKLNLKIIEANVENGKYKVIKKQCIRN